MSDGDEAEENSAIEQVFAGGAPQRVGWFRYFFEEDRWEWSPEVQIIHGYPAGAAHPTTDVVLSHKHADDYEHIAATLRDIRESHKPFSTRHRIITTGGQTRDVVVIGERLLDDSGDVVGTQGFYIDATPKPLGQEIITARVAEIAESRAIIEQAKGVLIYVYNLDEDAAFELLRWRSQETNHKLRALAEQLLRDVKTLRRDEETSASRLEFDRLLLTLHQRAD